MNSFGPIEIGLIVAIVVAIICLILFLVTLKSKTILNRKQRRIRLKRKANESVT